MKFVLKKKSFLSPLQLNTGQTMIEFLVLSVAFLSLILVLFGLAWIFINLIWIEHNLYQAIVCIAEERNPFFCENQFFKKIRALNPVAKITNLNFNSNSGELKWHFYKKDFVIRQAFKLPY